MVEGEDDPNWKVNTETQAVNRSLNEGQEDGNDVDLERDDTGSIEIEVIDQEAMQDEHA